MSTQKKGPASAKSVKKAPAKKTSAKKAPAKKTAQEGARSQGADDESGEGERLHKFLASTGAGSRRECETYIKQGRVTVNGKLVTKMGVKVLAGRDKVTFDGEVVSPEKLVYFLLNKPSGYICTNSDERGRPRAMDLIPDQRQRIYTVGRLDADSRGLILLTNDGTIANIICHPRYRVEKVYVVAIRGRLTREQVTKLEAGVWLAEGKSSPASVRRMQYDAKRDETYLEMTLFEGRNREIRRVFAKVGLKVRRLVRTRLGPLALGKLAPGASVNLDAADLAFVDEAQRLYEANREMWDSELPRQSRQNRGPRPSGTGFQRAPRQGGPNQAAPRDGGRGPARGPRQGGGGRPSGPARAPSRPAARDGKPSGSTGGEPPAPRRGRKYYT
jgi:23S rRNA pseudouridine2605 synthase